MLGRDRRNRYARGQRLRTSASKASEETLGLSRAGAEDGEVLVFESGDTTINVSRSSFAGTNKATALT